MLQVHLNGWVEGTAQYAGAGVPGADTGAWW